MSRFLDASFLAYVIMTIFLQNIFCSKIVGKLSYIMSNPIARNIFFAKDHYLQNNRNKHKQHLILKKDEQIFCSENQTSKRLYLDNYNFVKNKKLITISPGGYRGFYALGTCCFIKENYNINNYIFSGASAGAWNSLFMTFKRDPVDLSLKILNEDLELQNTIKDVQQAMKELFLNNYATEDFDLTRLFIGVTSLNAVKPCTYIFSDFEDLEDAINCCIASSHIPFITGPLTQKYNNQMVFDGGFSSYPYLNVKDSSLHITPSIWKKTYEKDFLGGYTRLLLKSKYSYVELYDSGYNDAKKNKNVLDRIFLESSANQESQDL